MSSPEISRRCRVCGASVRAGARFCQQCGTGMEKSAARREADTPSVGVEQGKPPAPLGAHGAVGRGPETAGADEMGADARDRAGAARRRPAAIMKENLLPRVEKMREASIVVLEEASEDSGMRFVLIAVALFLLFLFFLFVSSLLR